MSRKWAIPTTLLRFLEVFKTVGSEVMWVCLTKEQPEHSLFIERTTIGASRGCRPKPYQLQQAARLDASGEQRLHVPGRLPEAAGRHQHLVEGGPMRIEPGGGGVFGWEWVALVPDWFYSFVEVIGFPKGQAHMTLGVSHLDLASDGEPPNGWLPSS